MFEFPSAASECLEDSHRIKQILVVTLGPVQVLESQGEPQPLGQAVLALVLTKDGTTQFGVVGPRARVEELLGSGVFYGAAVSEAAAMREHPVFVVGGSNSAGQTAITWRNMQALSRSWCAPNR